MAHAAHSSPGLLECLIPPAPTYTDGAANTGRTSVRIVSAVGLTSNRLQFTYFTPPVILGVTPSFGSVHGGTLIVVTGVGFANFGGVGCLIGGVEQPGEALSGTEISCMSPSLASGAWRSAEHRIVPVLVTLNGMHYGRDASGQLENVTFEYANLPVVSYISPNTGISGQGDYGKSDTLEQETAPLHVRVHGAHFRDDVDLACRFGTALTVARYVSPAAIDCVIPPISSETGETPAVHITLNGVDFSRQSLPSATFTYVQSPEVLGISPKIGSASGGTAVTVIGHGFRNGEETLQRSPLICRFEVEKPRSFGTDANNFADPVVYDVGARVESDNAAVCVSPTVFLANATESGHATIRVSANGGLSFSRSAQRFAFHPEAIVIQVTPGTVPAITKGTILVSGEGFLQGEGYLSCVFTPSTTADSHGVSLGGGSVIKVVDGKDAFATAAIWLSSELIRCAVPDVQVDEATSVTLVVSATNNGVDAMSSAGRIIVYAAPTVRTLEPAAGPVTGGTVVTLGVDGWGLPAAAHASLLVKCQWGANVSTPGELSATDAPERVVVACASPSAAAVASADRDVKVSDRLEVSLLIDNSKISSARGLYFDVYDTPVVLNASPSAGGELGGTDLVLTGSGFSFGAPGKHGAGKAVCMFEETPALSAVVSDTELRCRSPAFESVQKGEGSSINIRVSLNGGVDVGSTFVIFRYLPHASVTGESVAEETYV